MQSVGSTGINLLFQGANQAITAFKAGKQAAKAAKGVAIIGGHAAEAIVAGRLAERADIAAAGLSIATGNADFKLSLLGRLALHPAALLDLNFNPFALRNLFGSVSDLLTVVGQGMPLLVKALPRPNPERLGRLAAVMGRSCAFVTKVSVPLVKAMPYVGGLALIFTVIASVKIGRGLRTYGCDAKWLALQVVSTVGAGMQLTAITLGILESFNMCATAAIASSIPFVVISGPVLAAGLTAGSAAISLSLIVTYLYLKTNPEKVYLQAKKEAQAQALPV